MYNIGWKLKFDPASLSGRFRITLFQYRDTLVLPKIKYWARHLSSDEVKELEKEGEADLDVDDLRKKMMEAKIEDKKAKSESEQKKQAAEGNEEKSGEDQVEKSKDADGHGSKPDVEVEKKPADK